MALQTYLGNCHCGAFRFRITCPAITTAKACNCSMCTKKQYLWIEVHVSKFEITRGEEEGLTSYMFGGEKMMHEFCPICGTGILMRRLNGVEENRGEEEIRINVRTLLDIDPFALKIEKVDGQVLKSEYTHPKFKGEPFELGEQEPGMKIYTGGCHCGAATIAVKSKPLAEI